MRKGSRLAERWSEHVITFETISMSDWALLQDHWNGNDVRRLLEIKKAARRPPNHNARTLALDLAVSRESDAALLQSMPSRSSTAAEHAIAHCLRFAGFLDLAETAWRCMVM